MESTTDKHHVRVVFKTNSAQHVIVDAKSFSVPKTIGPDELNDVVNALLRSEHPVLMNFFVGEALVHKSLGEAIEAVAASTEDIVEVFYTPRVQPKTVNSVPHVDWVSSIAAAGDNLFLTGSYDFRIRLSRIGEQDANVIHEGNGHQGAITGVCMVRKPQADTRAFQCASASQDGTVALWDYTSESGFKQGASFRPHTCSVTAVKYSTQHESLLSAGYDGTLAMWRPESSAEIAHFQGHTNGVTDCAFVDDAVLSGSMDGALKLWDLNTRQETSAIPTSHAIFCLDTRPDDSLVLSGHANCTVTLADYRAGKMHASMRGHSKWIYAVAFGTGQQFLSASEDKSICLWDLRFAKSPFYSSKQVHSDAVLAAIHCGGSTFATGGKDRQLVVTEFAA